MQMSHFWLVALAASVAATRYTINDRNNPIRIVDTSTGIYRERRLDRVVAVIQPHHVSPSNRVNFATSGELERYYQIIRGDGDERGHIVASQFSGPPVWYNLTPQNARVNRNAGFQAITTDWYGAECEVRRFLDQGGNRYCYWHVEMFYVGDSNRPDIYRLRCDFIENNQIVDSIDTTIHNPFAREDSTFWVCRQCRSNRHEHDEVKRRSLIEGGCSK